MLQMNFMKMVQVALLPESIVGKLPDEDRVKYLEYLLRSDEKLEERELSEMTILHVNQVKSARRRLAKERAAALKERKVKERHLDIFKDFSEEKQLECVRYYLSSHPNHHHIIVDGENHKPLHWLRFSTKDPPPTEQYSDQYFVTKKRFQKELFDEFLKIAFGSHDYGLYFIARYITSFKADVTIDALKDYGYHVVSTLTGEQTTRIMIYCNMAFNEKRRLSTILTNIIGFQLLASDKQLKRVKEQALHDYPNLTMKGPVEINNLAIQWWETNLPDIIE